MFGDALVSSSLMVVFDNEDHVETRQDRGLEIDILTRSLEIIVSTEDGIGSSKDRCPCVEDGSDACLGDGDRLLLHGFVDRYSVFVTHLVELIDADYTSIRKHHRSALEVEFSGRVIALDGRCQTCCGGSLAGCVDGDRGYFLDELEELGLRCSGITEEKDVDVPTELHAVWENLLRSTKQEAGDRILDILIAVDGRCDAVCEDVVEIWSSAHLQELLLFFLGEDCIALCSVVDIAMDSNCSEIRGSDSDCGGCRGAFRLLILEDGEDTGDHTS